MIEEDIVEGLSSFASFATFCSNPVLREECSQKVAKGAKKRRFTGGTSLQKTLTRHARSRGLTVKARISVGCDSDSNSYCGLLVWRRTGWNSPRQRRRPSLPRQEGRLPGIERAGVSRRSVCAKADAIRTETIVRIPNGVELT